MKNIFFASLLFISPMVIQPGFSADAPHVRDDGSFTFSSKFSTPFRMHMERKIQRRIDNGKLTAQDEINALKESMDMKYQPFAKKKMDDNCRNFFTKYFSRNIVAMNSNSTNLLKKILPVLFYAGDFGDSDNPKLDTIEKFFKKNTGKKVTQRKMPVTMSDDHRNTLRKSNLKSAKNYWERVSSDERAARGKKQSETMRNYWANLDPEDRKRVKEANIFKERVKKLERKDEAERNRVASLPLSHIPQAQRIELARRVSERSAAAVREALREQEEVAGQLGKRHRDNTEKTPQPKIRKVREERALGEVPQDHDGAHRVPQSQNTEHVSFRVRAPRDVSPLPRIEQSEIFGMSDKQRQKIAERLRQKNNIAIQKALQKAAKKG